MSDALVLMGFIIMFLILPFTSNCVRAEESLKPEGLTREFLAKFGDGNGFDDFDARFVDMGPSVEFSNKLVEIGRRVNDGLGGFEVVIMNVVNKDIFRRASFALVGRDDLYLADFLYYNSGGWRIVSFCFDSNIEKTADYYVDDKVMPACQR